ncbi:MAG: UDP-N-acetylglucosamine 2-epimerase [Candidatus Melainabacteria bacterium RIFCSPHIGHO2_02_FULL_34_12]|nr:MAG: UDP-N-acetylglucosamine 2-epimerase [Candidatus Melainabacteria bacterium RIFCSPHIGHO2_02_FULL_34_12]
MKKIAIIVGTRPEVIKLAPVYLELKKSKILKPILINTGQHREMVDQMLRWFGIKEDFNLKLMKINQTLPGLTAKVIEATYKVFEKIKPHLVMVEGDTATVMAASIAAFYLKIPVAHVEAGLRTNDIYNPFPEEMSRRLVSHLASVHFAPTENAVQNLKKENIKSNIFLTGNTVIDALLYTAKNLKIEKQLIASLPNFKKYRVILVTMHRRENFGSSHRAIAKTLIKILNNFPDTAVLLPLHLNPKVRNVIKPILKNHKRVFLIEPPGYVPFIYAMKNSYLIMSDSGGVQEEAPTLGKPVLVLRTNTERPEGIKAGSAKLVGINPEKIFKEASKLLTDKKAYRKMTHVKNPYGDGKAAKRIRKILEKQFMSMTLI